ncbi:TraM recognition domain-containing protein [Opitutus sp. ER46]|uniref:type IV secretory system conjugative DNA transfer family protein n=1 Tax=Opitutus sp. ER46 TaxID=2161864 RepID=UPI000D313200|nr:TraM recognition domain-containing protein [Opitutus sp. ER46]PTX92330.1 hypothetical protein DB354_13385 [Opitutus sp. ER46]
MPASAAPQPRDPLDEILLSFSSSDHFTVRDACEGVQIFGGIGSGKTSGSGALLARSYLLAGLGGLVLTAKPDEADLWRQYANQTGRSKDLLVFDDRGPCRFNALEYECKRPGRGSGITENLVELFDVLVQVASRTSAPPVGENAVFWRTQRRMLLRNSLEALRLARVPVTFENVSKLINSAPRTAEETRDGKRKNSFCYEVFLSAVQLLEAGKMSPADAHDWEKTNHYWAHAFPVIEPRQQTTIIGSFTGMADPFQRGMLWELFGTTTTIRPEDSLNGKIIVLDLPQKLYNELGVYAQVLFKFCWQRAVERRKPDRHALPVFLWIDEAQHFVNEYDVGFQTTSRSSRVCTVLLTQNLPNYRYYLGGDQRAQALTESLLGNLVTKIFHNNTCAVTNQYAADLFGRDWRERVSSTSSCDDGKVRLSTNRADELRHVVEPREFAGLRKGGPENGYVVEGIIHQGGKVFGASHLNALLTEFHQRQ